ncbi:hypothetical protein SADUNF_Sadunf02G0028700 [Salix dunnii]|uniref:Uncharacterized protein n=1 Tax=Salix dunnii TaxID=1413687 RepID=A0A835N5S3_9ROSI|nr:hypothetical protein SADUNF_Sadunf02G0028700 [Salix dunnii]
MEARDIKPTKEIYMALLRSFSQDRDIGGAGRIATTTQFAGFQPSLESCALLVEAYGHTGDEVEQLLDMISVHGFEKKPLQAPGVLEAKKEQLGHELERICGCLNEVASLVGMVEWQYWQLANQEVACIAETFLPSSRYALQAEIWLDSKRGKRQKESEFEDGNRKVSRPFQDQRPFRFRLPWLSAPAPGPRPTAEPRPPRPTVEIQAPARPTTAIQRPPFRPAGIAPALTPATQTTAREQTESQPVPTRRAATESQVNSQPVSPSREKGAASLPPSPSRETGAASVPPSPSRETPQSIAASVLPSPSRRTQPQAASQTQSPSRETPQSIAASVLPSPSRTRTQPQAAFQTQSPSRATPRSRAASVVPSPSRTTSQPQSAAAVTVPQTQSSSGLATQVPGRKSPQLSSPSKTAIQTQPTVSQSPSKKLQRATQEISQPPSKPPQSDTQQEETKPTPAAEPVLESDAVTAATPTLTPVPALETPAALQKSDPRTIGADHPTTLSEPVKRAKEDIFETKKTTTISPNGETIKTAGTRYAFGESHQRKSMSNGEKVPLHKEIGEDISKLAHKLGMEHMKHPMGEKSVSIVTLAGENRGATMNMGFESTRKDRSVHIHRGYKINPDESSEATTDGEGSSKGRSSEDLLTKEDSARKAYINSNTQSVNNSMLFETSVGERNPGVQLSLSYNDEEPSKNSSKPVHLETRKAEFQVTPAEKLSYEPTVKRRCLRGLFMESSDSDLDNPEKPRRHGCRYNCGKKS